MASLAANQRLKRLNSFLIMSKKRQSPITVFIACEGRNSEYLYFERIKETIEDDNFFAVTVYPDKNEISPKTDVIGLINEAMSRIDEFDEVWVVYDKNGYTKHAEAIALANIPINGKTVNIAFSSIAFEHWILLHFEKNQTAFTKADCKDENGKPINCGTGIQVGDCMGHRCIAGILRSKGYYPGYSKKTHIDIYTTIKDRLDVAMENAAWLRYRMTGALAAVPLYAINPYTDVDVLLRRLMRIDKEITWLLNGSQIMKENLLIQLSFNNPDLELTLTNGKGTAIIVNQVSCSTVNNGLLSPVAFPNTVIPPGQTIATSVPLVQAPDAVRLVYENHYLFFEI
jgi:hypothetical protein